MSASLERTADAVSFAIGDTVVLRSGGPHMTIVDTITKPAGSGHVGEAAYQCAYFDSNGVARLIGLLPATIKKAGIFSEEQSQ